MSADCPNCGSPRAELAPDFYWSCDTYIETPHKPGASCCKITQLRADRDALLAVLKSLQNWRDPDSVTGSGSYHTGLCCGVEDKGLQSDGYGAMRYGYECALDRVSEEIDGQIKDAIARAEKGGV